MTNMSHEALQSVLNDIWVSKRLTPLHKLRSLNMASDLRVAGLLDGHRVSLGRVGHSECRSLIDKGFSTV